MLPHEGAHLGTVVTPVGARSLTRRGHQHDSYLHFRAEYGRVVCPAIGQCQLVNPLYRPDWPVLSCTDWDPETREARPMKYDPRLSTQRHVASGHERLAYLAAFLDTVAPDRVTFSRWYGSGKGCAVGLAAVESTGLSWEAR